MIISKKLEEILCIEAEKMAAIMVIYISKHSRNKLYSPCMYKENRKEYVCFTTYYTCFDYCTGSAILGFNNMLSNINKSK